jgi:hypothetical protein
VTTLALQPPRPVSVVTDLADCVEDLASIAGDGCLVESTSGRLVAHALRPAGTTPEIVGAVVAGELSTLHQGLSVRRTAGVLASSAVVEGLLSDGRRVGHLLLRDAGLALGGLWLLPRAAGDLPLEALRLPVQRLTELLALSTPGSSEPTLSGCLEGGPIPADIAAMQQLWVARISADATDDRLARAAARARCPLTVRAASTGCGAYLVLAGRRPLSARQVTRAVQSVCDQVAQELGLVVTAGVSAGHEPGALMAARAQADAAAREAAPGACVAVTDVRSRAVLRRLAPAVQGLPDLGPDPLTALRDYDARHGSDLGPTLLAWLDAFGDVPRVTATLAVHANTVRYRLRRIQEITGVDLRADAAGRLELHLRLHTQEIR